MSTDSSGDDDWIPPSTPESFDTEDERMMLNLLDEWTDDRLIFKRSEGRYDIDGVVEHVDRRGEPIGWVELEHGKKWRTHNRPNDWVFYSLLKRKIIAHTPNGEGKNPENPQCYWHEHRPHHETKYKRTLYIKFNNPMTNCFAIPMEVVFEDGVDTRRTDGTKANSYLKIDFDHPNAYEGREEVSEFVDDFMLDLYQHTE